MFRPKKPLLVTDILSVPHGPGVYIIYAADGSPFYIGRSIVSIHARLHAHAAKRGSRKIAEALNISENTVKSRMYYGLDGLKKILEKKRITKETIGYEL